MSRQMIVSSRGNRFNYVRLQVNRDLESLYNSANVKQLEKAEQGLNPRSVWCVCVCFAKADWLLYNYAILLWELLQGDLYPDGNCY